MRDVIVILVILLLVFGGGMISGKYIESSASVLLKHLEEMYENFNVTKEEKKVIVKDLKDTWEKIESFWIVFEYHDMINDIEDALVESYMFYLADSKSDFMASYGKVKRMVDDLKNRGTLTYVNIF